LKKTVVVGGRASVRLFSGENMIVVEGSIKKTLYHEIVDRVAVRNDQKAVSRLASILSMWDKSVPHAGPIEYGQHTDDLRDGDPVLHRVGASLHKAHHGSFDSKERK
jgi:hypothetical protein